jgi:hypothetical protein
VVAFYNAKNVVDDVSFQIWCAIIPNDKVFQLFLMVCIIYIEFQDLTNKYVSSNQTYLFSFFTWLAYLTFSYSWFASTLFSPRSLL